MLTAAYDVKIIPQAIPRTRKPRTSAELIFAELSDYLIASIRNQFPARASAQMPPLAKIARRACERFELTDYRTAAELFAVVTEMDNVLECGFLGAALCFHKSGHLPAARNYVQQAMTLNKLLGGAERMAIYERFLEGVEEEQAEIRRNQIALQKTGLVGTNGRPQETAPWYWRYVRRHPTRDRVQDIDGFDEFLLNGLVPETPFLTRSDKIATIGSCFAHNVAIYLTKIGYCTATDPTLRGPESHLYVDDNFFNSFVIREAFEYAFGGDLHRDHWVHDAGPGEAGSNGKKIAYNIDRVRAALANADVYVVTLGLSEIWYNRTDNLVYPSGVNIEVFDPEIHGFRVSSVEENFENIEAIYDLIRTHRPGAAIVFTLSPVPLAATFRDMNCIAANSVSKAVLRLAIDRLAERHKADDRLFYYPSYEIVRDYFPDSFGDDMRHVKDPVIRFVVDQFLRRFFVD